ncbi:MAG TPA: beta-ketoacyl synthase N-terminal-like domain-containing protein [Gemmatimonadaceae bacterium]|nr:beta-ketoacyl synthase N-terminal-like domain-containing protein [Gemmatimonadaceae bacterium]
MRRTAPREVAVTGMGAVSALGDDVTQHWDSVARGVCGIGTIRRFDTSAYSVHTGAEARSTAEPGDSEALCFDFALRAGREALGDARLGDAVHARRIAIVFGTGITELEHPLHEVVERLAAALGIDGPRLTVSTACSSSTAAIGIARDLLALDAADAVLAGGSDVLTPEVFSGFHALGVLSATRCAPFSTSVGTTLGEGAGFMVLERADDARSRAARVHVYLSGWGLSGDAWHETSPDPKGSGIERAIRAALADADAAPESIEYVNAHGSGTSANDGAEWLGIRRAIGEHACAIPVSSTKGALGHAQGAAGVLEGIVTVLSMQRGVVPPTLNMTAARPYVTPDPVPGPLPRAHATTRALSINSAFGGANVAIVLDRALTAPPRQREPIALRGFGLVGAFGCGVAAFRAADDAQRRGHGRVPSFDVRAHLPTADARTLDPSSRNLATATALALADAGIRLRGDARDRTGLLVGQRRASPVSLQAFFDSISANGLPNLSAVAFARVVLNAAAGTCSKLLSLRGPLSAITCGAGSGLAAIVVAAEILATRSDVDTMIAGGVDEHPEDGSDVTDAAVMDGAGCVALSRGSGAGDSLRLAGWAIAGPRQGADAARRALEGHSADGVTYVCLDDWAGASAGGAVFGLADAVLHANGDQVPALLAMSEAGDSLSSALLLTRTTP